MRHKLLLILTTLIIIALLPAPALAADKGAAPVAYWRFDEGGGPTAYDDAGANDGTLTSASFTRSGKINNAVSFANSTSTLGTTHYVQAAEAAAIRPQSELTIECWANASAFASGANIVLEKNLNTGKSEYWLRSLGNGAGWQCLVRTTTKVKDLSYSTSLQTGQWYHLAMVYSESGNSFKLYMDGREVASNSLDSGSWSVSDDVFTVGGSNNASYYGWNGKIDDVKIYDYARTAAQVLVDYNAGSAAHLGAGTDPNEGNPPIVYLPFDEGTGTTTAYDRSGNNNNGTLINMEATDWVAGKHGRCLDFDGTDESVTLAVGTLNGLSAFSFTCWFYADGNQTGYSEIIQNDNASDFFIRYNSGMGNFQYYLGITGTNSVTINVPAAGVWHHVGYTYDGTNTKAYLDGIQVGATGSSVSGAYSNLSTLTYIANWSTSEGLKGKIDEVKIYNYARTQAQIAYDYSKGAPVAHYRFDEGAGTIARNDVSSADSGAAPVGWWRMDTASSGSANGASVTDSSGNGNNGTASYGANTAGMSWTGGKIGLGALDFDGADDYVTIPHNNNLNASGDLTITAWVKFDALVHNNHIVSKNLYASSSYTLFVTSAGALYVNTKNQNGDSILADSVGSAVGTGNWYHVTAVIKTDDKIYLYVNGAEVTYNRQQSYSSTDDLTNNQPVIISSSGSATTVDGQIDDVRIYNYARSAEQIYNDYKTTHGTLVGDTKFVDGKLGKAVYCDGAGDYIGVPDNDVLDMGTGDMTFEAWAYIYDEASNWGDIVGKGSWNGVKTYGIVNAYDSGYNEVCGYLANNGTSDRILTPKYSPTAETWHHYAVVFDRDANMTLYVDGKSYGSASISSYSAIDFNNTAAVQIGQYSGWAVKSTIDDVRIYNYARSAAQILDDYNSGTSRHGASRAGEADPWGGALPVGHWRMDENTGVLARDASEKNNNGTINGNPQWTQGAKCPCLVFDGAGDYVDCGDPADGSLDMGTSNFSVSFWYKHSGTIQSGHDTIVGKKGGSWNDAGWLFRTPTAGQVTFHIGNSSAYDEFTANVSAAAWHHVVGVRNGTTIYLYIDGRLDGSETNAIYDDSLNNAISLKIGYLAGWNYFAGHVDDVRIYNYALSQAQVAWLCNAGKPVGYWRFDEAVSGAVSISAGAIKDDSIHNNDGTASNTTWTYTTGKFGGCLNFDGNDYVDCGTGSSLNISNSITVSAWAKPTSVAGSQGLVGRHTDGNNAAGTLRFSGANVQVVTNIGGAYTSFDTSNSPLTANVWQHVAYTYNGSVEKIYVNGVEKAERNNSGVIYTPAPHTWIGETYSVGAQPFTGQIDDVRVYNYARTAAQILQDFNAGAASRLGD